MLAISDNKEELMIKETKQVEWEAIGFSHM